METNRMNSSSSSRKLPLHTCAVTLLAIAHKTSNKAQQHNGPLGTLVKNYIILATLASPILSAAQYLILATLILADDYILACEDNLGSIYPPSNLVFNSIDDLVRAAETLPEKVDEVWDEVAKWVCLVPFLECALMNIVLWLSFLLSCLIGLVSGETEEGEIIVDENYMKSNENSCKEGNEEDVAKVVGKVTDTSCNNCAVVGFSSHTDDIVDREKGVAKESSLKDENGGEIMKESSCKKVNEKDVARVADEVTGILCNNYEVARFNSHVKDIVDREEEGVAKESSLKDENWEEIVKESSCKQLNEENAAETASEMANTSYNTHEVADSNLHANNIVDQEKEVIAKESSYIEENESIANESSYDTDVTDGSVNEEVIAILKDDRPDNAIGSSNETRKGEKGMENNGSNVKPSLAKEWIEAGWATKPKQATKRKQKSKKKRN